MTTTMITTTRTRAVIIVTLALWTTMATPALARAEGLLTGVVGSRFGEQTDSAATIFGGSIGASAGGIFGFELDLATTRDIFGLRGLSAATGVTTVMGNLIVGLPISVVRPYGTVGVGVLRTSVTGGDESSKSTDIGMNLGGGVMAFFSEHLGVRGDLRYFRGGRPDFGALLDFDNVDFWRGTAGAVLRW